MLMRAETLGPWLDAPDVALWPELGGYSSIEDAVDKIFERFPHHNPRRYGNGVELDHIVWGIDAGIIHVGVRRITFVEGLNDA